MDLEERHFIKLLRIKGLKRGEIAKELSNAYGPDAYIRLSIKHWLHQIKLGEPISECDILVGDHLSTILMPKFYHFAENSHSLQ
jgi:hypothetical protein